MAKVAQPRLAHIAALSEFAHTLQASGLVLSEPPHSSPPVGRDRRGGVAARPAWDRATLRVGVRRRPALPALTVAVMLVARLARLARESSSSFLARTKACDFPVTLRIEERAGERRLVAPRPPEEASGVVGRVALKLATACDSCAERVGVTGRRADGPRERLPVFSRYERALSS